MKARIKEKLQAYLRGEREGFSLVELIIVIAIMAILIGVIALAVIPYLAKSKESKDLSTLDNASSALKTAVAETKVNGSGEFEYSSNASGLSGDEKKICEAMVRVLGTDTKIEFNSNQFTSTGKLFCYYNTSGGANTLIVYAGTTKGTAVCSEFNETGYNSDCKKMSSSDTASSKGKGYAFVVGNGDHS